MIDLGLSKKEKKEILRELEKLQRTVTKLQEGGADVIREDFKGIFSAIENSLPDEQKIVLQVRKEASRHKNAAKEANEEVQKIRENLFNLKQELEQTLEHGNTTNSRLAEAVNSINDVKSKVDDAFANISNLQIELNEKINVANQHLLKAEELKNKVNGFEELVNESIDHSKKISTIHAKSNKLHSEVKTIHDEVFGYSEEGEDGEIVEVSGLKDELEEAYAGIKGKVNSYSEELGQFKKNKEEEYLQVKEKWDNEFVETDKKIKSLLPGAMSVGLSYAYKEKKDDEIIEKDKQQKIFMISIIAMMVVSLIPVVVNSYLLITAQKTLDQVVAQAPMLLVIIGPLYAPLLWVAFTSSKKVNLSKRLVEEYAHKEALSKTYEGLANQVENIDDTSISKELSSELLSSLISTSSSNPGELISGYDKSDHPLQELIQKGESLLSSFENIADPKKLGSTLKTILTSNREDELNDVLRANKDNDTASGTPLS